MSRKDAASRRGVGRALLAALPALALAAGAGEAKGERAGPPGPADLVEVTDISGLSASPDGRHVAFRSERASLDRNSYALTWHIAEIAGPGRLEADGGLPVYIDPGLVQIEPGFWSPDGRALFYRALVDGAIGLWRVRLDGSGPAPLLVDDADIETVRLAADGEGLDLELGPTRAAIRRAEEAEYDSGILIDSSVDLAQNLFRGGSIGGRMATQRLTGNWFRRAGLLAAEPRRRLRLSFANGAIDPAPAARLPDAATGSTSEEVRAADGSVATISEGDAGSRIEVRLPGAAGPIICPTPLCARGRIDSVIWRPDHRELLVTMSDRFHRQSLHLWDPVRTTVRRVAAAEGLLNGGRTARSPCAITSVYAVCVAAGPVAPPRLERIELDTGRRETLFDPNAALRARSWPRMELLRWSAGSQDYTGVLLLPDNERSGRRLPLLINYYRCEGFLRGGVGDEIPFAPLAQAGFAVLCINAPPLGGAHDARATYRTGLAGVRAAIDLLAARGLVDRGRVGMAGLSFGSEVTMWTAMHSELLAAAAIASVQFEPAYFWFNALRGRDHPDILRRSWGLGPPDEDEAGWREVSPALNVAAIRAPLLMQLPEQEARYVIELHARLSNSTTPVELHAFPDEAHIKLQPRHKLATYTRYLDWFRFWLQGHVDPDPGRREQYRRWQALRERQASAGRTTPPTGQP